MSFRRRSFRPSAMSAAMLNIRAVNLNQGNAMTADNETLKTMVANFAVLEQLVINLTHLVTSEYEDTVGIRSAVMQDIRDRFNPIRNGITDRATLELYERASDQIERLEPRILGDIADVTKQ
jgi:hypothetical protein